MNATVGNVDFIISKIRIHYKQGVKYIFFCYMFLNKQITCSERTRFRKIGVEAGRPIRLTQLCFRTIDLGTYDVTCCRVAHEECKGAVTSHFWSGCLWQRLRCSLRQCHHFAECLLSSPGSALPFQLPADAHPVRKQWWLQSARTFSKFLTSGWCLSIYF